MYFDTIQNQIYQDGQKTDMKFYCEQDSPTLTE